MEQGSQEWHAARLGKITGTKAHNLLSGDKTRKTLLIQLFREIATAEAKETPETDDMRRGKELEAEAIKAYTKKTGYPIHGDQDYIVHPTEPRFTFSPDGLAREDGGIEIKCRQPEHHIRRMIYGIEKDELHQCEWGLFVTGREWWDYVAFCPELPEKIRMFTRRITLTTERREGINLLGTQLLEDLDSTTTKFGLGF